MNRFSRTLVCTAVLFTACQRHPYYMNTYLAHQRPTVEVQRSRLVIDLDADIKAGRIRSFAVRTPERTIQVHPPTSYVPLLDGLPLPVLTAAWMVVHSKSRGAEWDLLLPDRRGALLPVTAWLEPGGDLTVEMGVPPPALQPPFPSAAEVAARHGIGEIRDGDAAWTSEQIKLLDEALGLLGDSEREALRGLPFRRQHAPPRGRSQTTGRYQTQDEEAHIEIYDRAFESDRSHFCGTPGAARPSSLLVMLHELGHGVADAPRLQQFRRLRRLLKEYRGKLERVNSGGDQGAVAKFEKEMAALQREMGALALRLKELRRVDPVLASFASMRGKVKGPTEYGRTSIDESFAESFALYRADPAALRRVYPGVADWFAAGGHLKAMARAGLPAASSRLAATDTRPPSPVAQQAPPSPQPAPPAAQPPVAPPPPAAQLPPDSQDPQPPDPAPSPSMDQDQPPSTEGQPDFPGEQTDEIGGAAPSGG